jgi:menaquinone-dependent protoporphyrinogen oxidase
MKEKILVAYATKSGSTGDIAGTVAETLRENGKDAEAREISDIFDISPYTTIIIGSPIYHHKVLPDIMPFVRDHQNMLREIPVLAFLTGYTLVDISPERKKAASRAFDEIRNYIEIRETGYFAGKVSDDGFNLREKAAMKMEGIKPGDFRNKTAVRAWTQGLIDLRLLQM